MDFINEIYQRFIDFYGEDRVELKDYYKPNGQPCVKIEGCYANSGFRCSSDKVIMIHWPTCTVTNEFDNSVDIWDLYAIVLINENGQLVAPFMLNRSTYDTVQWNSDYLHSHVSGIYKNDLSLFRSSCLGSGPIRNTIERLKDTGYTDLDIWTLFCWELDKYVHVESEVGVPYRHMKDIGNVNHHVESSKRSKFLIQPCYYIYRTNIAFILKDFVKEVIKRRALKFTFFNNKYTIAHSYIETNLKLSNLFISWFNASNYLRDYRNVINNNLLKNCVIVGNSIFEKEGTNTSPLTAAGLHLFDFKGQPVTLKFTDFNQDYRSNDLLLLDPSFVDYIVYVILKYINLIYGNEVNTINKKSRVL